MSIRFRFRLKKVIENIKQGVDRLSPYPKHYPFIMSEAEKALFDGVIRKSRHYLEFGLGGSTLRAIQKSRAKIYTVESSPDWIATMRRYLALRWAEKQRVCIFPVDIGPTGNWGYPESNASQHSFESYSAGIFTSIDARCIDLILIDGRFRVACTLSAIRACGTSKGILIMIHDFWNRSHYHSVLKYLDVVERVDTLAIFSIKENIDSQAVEESYQSYKNDAR